MTHNRRAVKTLKIGFVMDPMDRLLYRYDTSLILMREAESRGHQIFYLEPRDLFYDQGSVHADAREVKILGRKRLKVVHRSMINLKTLDAIVNRKDPPFNLSYLYLTQLLALLEPDVLIMNSPRGLQKANEKLYILEWSRWIPPTLVTNDPAKIKHFRRQQKADIILKSLNQKGGKGIYLLRKKAGGAERLLRTVTQNGKKWIMAQKFIAKGATAGDKRILILNGKVIGQFRRVPKRGEFRANLSLGGTAEKINLTRRDRALVRDLKPKLLRDGLYFAGIDVVDGWLIEINVTSPAGIYDLNALGSAHPEVPVVNFLEERVSGRR